MLLQTSLELKHAWLKSVYLWLESKNFIEKLNDSQVAYYFNVNKKLIFGTAGIRAPMGPGPGFLNEITYRQIIFGYALNLQKKYSSGQLIKILIGHDNRLHSAEFAQICADTLVSFGIHAVFVNGHHLLATPIISYVIRKNHYQGGINITASHNVSTDNGCKLYNSAGLQVDDDEATIILANMPSIEVILQETLNPNPDFIENISNEIISQYFHDVKGCLLETNTHIIKNFPIVFTAHNGTTSLLIPRFLHSLGYKNIISVEEECKCLGTFTVEPIWNPEHFRSFELSLHYADWHHANVIVATDPDGDRFTAAIRTLNGWRYLTGNETAILFLYYILKHCKFSTHPFLIRSVVSTDYVDRLMHDMDGVVYRTQTGFRWICKKLEEMTNLNGFTLAFEEAIGLLLTPINREKDSFQATALFLEMVDFYQKENLNLIEVLEQKIFPHYGYWSGETVNIILPCNDSTASKKLMAIAQQSTNLSLTASFKIVDVKWNEIGQCVEWYSHDEVSWIKFRISGTEPKLKIYLNLYGSELQTLRHQHAEIRKKLLIIFNPLSLGNNSKTF